MGDQPPTSAQTGSDKDGPPVLPTLLTLPPDLLNHILASVTSRQSRAAALATCKHVRDCMLHPATTWTVAVPAPHQAYDPPCMHSAWIVGVRQAAEAAARALGTATAAGVPGCVLLCLSGTRGDGLPDALPADLDFTALRRLVLDSMELEGLVPDQVQQGCPHLEELVLQCCVVQKPPDSPAPPAPFPSLSRLEIRGCERHHQDVGPEAILAHCPPLPGVTRLAVTSSCASREAHDWLTLLRLGVVQPQQVSHLSLRLGSQPLPSALCQPDLWPALEHLELGPVQVGDELAACLVALPVLQHLAITWETRFSLTTDHRAAGAAAWGVKALVLQGPVIGAAALFGLAHLPAPQTVALAGLSELQGFGTQRAAALLADFAARSVRAPPLWGGVRFTMLGRPLPAWAVAPLLRHSEAVDLGKVQLGPELWDEAVRIAQHRVLALQGLQVGTQLPAAALQVFLYQRVEPICSNRNRLHKSVVLGPRPKLEDADVAALSPARAQQLVEQVAWDVLHCAMRRSFYPQDHQDLTDQLDTYFEGPGLLPERLGADLAQLKAALDTGLQAHDPAPVMDVLKERFGVVLHDYAISCVDDSYESSDGGSD